jgi:RNA polymerase sigma-70 factor (ECF subfamily)
MPFLAAYGVGKGLEGSLVVHTPPAQTPLDRAMDRYADGDEAAFATVYDLLAPRLFPYLLRHTGSRASAEDILQQTLFRMHQARGSFVRGAPVLPWAFAIARRLHIDSMRRGRREVLAREDDGVAEEAIAHDPRADELVAAAETAARLADEMGRLPENQRVAFRLVKEEGLSMAEAAAVLGVTVTAVKLRAHRAYEALRRALGEDAATKKETP